MKKHTKIALVIMALLIAVIAIIAYVILLKPGTPEETDAQEVITLEDGQSLVFAKLTSVIGNEITYVTVEEQDNSIYRETQETGQLQIPVGTEVITKLGTSTTFSRLASGDIIRLLMQQTQEGEEETVKIWIME